MCVQRWCIRRGFTLVELLVVMGIISSLSAVVISINPLRQLSGTRDAARARTANELRSALRQYAIDKGTLPNESSIPSSRAGAVSICAYGLSDSGCLSFDVLVPQYIATFPSRDPLETNPNHLGYTVYREGNGVQVIARYVGKDQLPAFGYDKAVTFASGENYAIGSVIDTLRGYAYVSLNTMPAKIVKVRLSDLTPVATMTLDAGEGYGRNGVIDVAGGYAYFVIVVNNFTPSKVIKIRLSDFTRVGTFTLANGEYYINSITIDRDGVYGYLPIGNSLTPLTELVKIRLTDMEREATLPLDYPTYGSAVRAVLDPAQEYLYLATSSAPAKILKIRVDNLIVVSTLTFDIGESSPADIAMDPGGSFLYVALYTTPGTIVKVRLADFTRVGALTFFAGEDYAPVFDVGPDGTHGYATVGTNPGAIVKIHIPTFIRVGSFGAKQGENLLYARDVLFDDERNQGYVASYTAPGKLIRFHLGL
ncbi:MAG: hypothetical protein Greene041619_1048 [Candidatus Peregrinibacteria bacterium Greene0416_19]|nr:MAG: hypothetical protein Greene041619_1048 [Candidatus Peregrinibacteria bacterium Greene0416_19]